MALVLGMDALGQSVPLVGWSDNSMLVSAMVSAQELFVATTLGNVDSAMIPLFLITKSKAFVPMTWTRCQ
jgi:hypothetical protein